MINSSLGSKIETELVVKSSTYESRILRLEPHLSYFSRVHHWPQNANEIDVFGPCWSLALFNFQNDEVCIKRRGQLISLNGYQAVFIPPFSVIDWRLKGGEIRFEGVISNHLVTGDLPNEPYLIRNKSLNKIPTAIAEVFRTLKESEFVVAVGKEEAPSAVASKTKNYIDRHFESELTMADVAKGLNINHSVMDRAFIKNYEMSPIEYRNRLRILEAAHRMILEPKSVTQTTFEVGFLGTNNFNKQFKKVMNVCPSKYSNLGSDKKLQKKLQKKLL